MIFIQYVEENIKQILENRGISIVKFEFESLNDFLRNPYIQYFTRDPNFDSFVICRDKEYELISKLKNGKHYKIGLLDGDITEIPEWCGQKIMVATRSLINI